MFHQICSFVSGKIQTQKIDPADQLVQLLLQGGFHVFEVADERRKRYPISIMASHPSAPDSAVWFYQREDDEKFIARSTQTNDNSPFGEVYGEMMGRLSDFNLEKGGTLKLRKGDDRWLSWLSEDSKRKARELGYPRKL